MGEFVDDTMGLSGLSTLWIFGNPYIRGGWQWDGASFNLVSLSISPFCSIGLIVWLISLSILVVGFFFIS